MRTAASLASALAVVTLALGAFAAAPVPGPIPVNRAPIAKAPQAPSFSDARRTPSGAHEAPYADGPISYDVEITNPAATALAGELVVESYVSAMLASPLTKVPVSVPAGGKAWVTFSDPAGLRRGSCEASRHRLTLGTLQKVLTTTPSCSFTSEGVDPFAAVPADTKQAQRANKMYYVSPSLQTSKIACEQPFGITAQIRNSSAVNATHARLEVDGPGNESAASAAQSVAAGQTSGNVVVKVPFTRAEPGSYTLRIKGDGAPLFQPSWRVDVKRACQLAIAFN